MDIWTEFHFSEADTGTKPVEILRTGTFIDRHGRQVEITADDLSAYAANFEAGERGQDVPVDVDHERGKAAGWLQKVWVEGKKLLALPDWNKLGLELVGEKIYRYLSASVDTASKTIHSVSLVNFPSVKGLAPAELSEGVYTFQTAPGLSERLVGGLTETIARILGRETTPSQIADLADGEPGTVRIGELLQARMHRTFTMIADDMAAAGLLNTEERKQFSSAVGEALEAFENNVGPAAERLVPVGVPDLWYFKEKVSEGGFDMGDKERAELREQVRQELLEEQAAKEKTRAELREEVRAEVEAEFAERQARRAELREFVDDLCGGEFGLAEKPEEVMSLLESIDDPEQLKAVQQMLKAKVVDFSERGSNRDGQPAKKRLPAEFAALLRDWVAGGEDIEEWFHANAAELGEMDNWDLSEFEEREE